MDRDSDVSGWEYTPYVEWAQLCNNSRPYYVELESTGIRIWRPVYNQVVLQVEVPVITQIWKDTLQKKEIDNG